MTDFFSNVSLWEVLGWTMLHFLWMGCIAIAIAAGVRWLVRRFSAELRYLSALACLLGVIATADKVDDLQGIAFRHLGLGVLRPRHDFQIAL